MEKIKVRIMVNVLKRLQKEAGLTEDQSKQALSIFIDHMNNEGYKVDLDKFFKGKHQEPAGNAKNIAKRACGKLGDKQIKINNNHKLKN
jgi:hypothetical protein